MIYVRISLFLWHYCQYYWSPLVLKILFLACSCPLLSALGNYIGRSCTSLRIREMEACKEIKVSKPHAHMLWGLMCCWQLQQPAQTPSSVLWTLGETTHPSAWRAHASPCFLTWKYVPLYWKHLFPDNPAFHGYISGSQSGNFFPFPMKQLIGMKQYIPLILMMLSFRYRIMKLFAIWVSVFVARVHPHLHPHTSADYQILVDWMCINKYIHKLFGFNLVVYHMYLHIYALNVCRLIRTILWMPVQLKSMPVQQNISSKEQ